MRRILGRWRRGRDSGAVAVEFALILPIFLMLVFAVIDFGRMINAQITLTEAAREGARTAAVTRNATTGRNRALQIANTALGAPGITATVTACPTFYNVNAIAQAHVTYQFNWVTPLGFLTGNGGGVSLEGDGVMPCVQ